MNNLGTWSARPIWHPTILTTVPVYWHRGSIAQLPLPNGAVGGWANAINDPGVIPPGIWISVSVPTRVSLCIVWQHGTITDLDDVVPSDTPPLVEPGGLYNWAQIARSSHSHPTGLL